MSSQLLGAESALRAIDDLADSGIGAQQLIEEASERIDRVVPSDGAFLAATDPQTTLTIGSGLVRDLPLDQCQPTWDYEFLVPDYMKFVDIAASGRHVADLHEATGGRPERSARWREFGTVTGFRSEVRATFSLGGAVWGIAQFDRLGDAPRYSEAERAWLEQVAPIVARGLRRALLSAPAVTPAHRGPGVVLLDEAGVVLSATAEAIGWLEEVDAVSIIHNGAVPMPIEAFAYASRARVPGSVPTARLRTRSGVWLTMHGSVLEGTDQLALMIEPAKGTDVAPLIVEAYGVTSRELDVIRLIARGLGTSEIASSLFLSPHTVRDHVKAVFEKTGVSSRGELVAKVFADHYAPIPH